MRISWSFRLSARVFLSLLFGVLSTQGSSHNLSLHFPREYANVTSNSSQHVYKFSSNEEHIDKQPAYHRENAHLPQKKPTDHEHNTSGIPAHNDRKPNDERGHKRSSILKPGIQPSLDKYSHEEAESLPHNNKSRVMTTSVEQYVPLSNYPSKLKNSRRNANKLKRPLQGRSLVHGLAKQSIEDTTSEHLQLVGTAIGLRLTRHIPNRTKHVGRNRNNARTKEGTKQAVTVARTSPRDIALFDKADDSMHKGLYVTRDLLDLNTTLLHRKLKPSSVVANSSKDTKPRKPESYLWKGLHDQHKRHRIFRRNFISSKRKSNISKKLSDKDGSKKSSRSKGAVLSAKEHKSSSDKNSERSLHRYKRKLDMDEPSPHQSLGRHKKSKRKRRRQMEYINNRIPMQRSRTYWPVRELYPYAYNLSPMQGNPNQYLRGLGVNPQPQKKKMLIPALYGYTPRENVYRKLDPWLLANQRHIFPVRRPAFGQGIRQQISRSEVQHGQARAQLVSQLKLPPQTFRPVYEGLRTEAMPREGYVQREETSTSRYPFANIQVAPKAFQQIQKTQNKLPLRYEGLHITPVTPSEEFPGKLGSIPGGQSNTGSCDVPVGLKSGAVTNAQMSSSSDLSSYHNAARGRLDATPSGDGLAGSWCASHEIVDKSQFLQVNLDRPKTICRLATQGQPEFSNWVTSYTLAYSSDGRVWTNYKENGADKVFVGNYDRDNTVVHDLNQPIRARYFRFQPQTWHFYDICLRAEMYTRAGDDVLSVSQLSGQALLVYLNFDQTHDQLEKSTGKRTYVTQALGSCGHVARLRNGSEILLDGDKMKVKPREAVTMAAWIRLDSNRGLHSIFDTVGNHSQHQNGQYHFEVEDGKLRWFHRNEAGQTVFSAKTDPLIPAGVWTHVAGMYDSRVGLAKMYINGNLRGVGTGKGLLSQDWSAHAGIGQHKGKRFLQGEVDEFRIYNQALTRNQIQKLVKLCNIAQDCGGLFQSPTGLIESPDWPSNYRGKHQCSWRIITDLGNRIALQFNNFSLEPNGACARARLVVRDGAKEDASVMATYCGQDGPASVMSRGNQMLVQFNSEVGATGRGFRISYSTSVNVTKRRTLAFGQARRCSVTKPKQNVTLVGGIHSGVFSEVPNANDMASCVRHCCLRQSCHLSFMIKSSCYLVDCFKVELCRTKTARPSSLFPQISYVEHMNIPSPVPGLASVQIPTTKTLASPNPKHHVAQQCHHTAISYNVTLMGGISAGKFSTYGTTSNMEECIHHCCHDNKCDVAFMIQGNCYTVECEDRDACQVKRAKPSVYHPTIAFVYRGNEPKPIGDALPGALTPNAGACQNQSVSDTLYNVTLRGGIKSGKFIDKGVVKNTSECSAYCCAEESCNVAFLIRDNCFLVACKDYESCHLKPALSEYYHPRLAYVNWSPPDQEIPTNKWYASLGCWRDTDDDAVPSLEGSDALLSDSFYSRLQPTDKCAQVARKHAYRVFAIQKGGACQGGPKAGRTFNRLGKSSACKDGKGGLFANSVYLLLDNGTYHALGCWRSSADHLLVPLELTDAHLMDLYETRSDPVRKCAEVARSRGFGVFAIQDGGLCYAGSEADKKYKTYGLSRNCRDGIGGGHANSVYKMMAKISLPKSTEAPMTQENVTINGGVQSKKPGIHEDFVTLDDGQPRLTSYTAESVLHNVTLKYGIKSGRFLDKGHVSNMSGCIKACGREETCRLAFMLGRQCFSVACHSDAMCQTKPAFSVFYKPQIAFVRHNTSKGDTSITKVQDGVCRSSPVHEGVTLVGGIHAGKFHDLGHADDMASCIRRCCQQEECEVAFMLEDECYGVTCANNTLCETRHARNPERYHPRIAYVYRGKMADQALTTQRPLQRGCWDGAILYNQTLVGGIDAGVFTDNGKADSMTKCMQFCCTKPRCDLAFMIEDDCYSVFCLLKEKCEPRKARPTHYSPRIAFTEKFKAASLHKDAPSSLASPLPHVGTLTPEPHQAYTPVHVEHSCNASPIEYNKTLKMGLHSGVFRKVGKVDTMDDCIEMSCRQPNSDVAFMLGAMCYSVRCYSDELCQTVPVFGDNLAGFNLKPAISFLRTKARIPSGGLDLAVETEGLTRDVHCRESTITYNVTLRGGISAGNFTERLNAETMRDCIGYCCDDVVCDLAFMFGTRCYSVACEDEKHCQAVLAKPSSLEPRISYVSRGLVQSRSQVIVLSENDDSSTCRADEIKHSRIFSNKSLAGGLESGSFKFLGKFRNMDLCMRRCCASTGCDVAYMVDKNCFSVKCYSSALCKISDVPTTNGNVEISTLFQLSPSTMEKHSTVVYVVVGVVAFMSGAGGIVWAICMFMKRHRMKMRNLKNQD